MKQKIILLSETNYHPTKLVLENLLAIDMKKNKKCDE